VAWTSLDLFLYHLEIWTYSEIWWSEVWAVVPLGEELIFLSLNLESDLPYSSSSWIWILLRGITFLNYHIWHLKYLIPSWSTLSLSILKPYSPSKLPVLQVLHSHYLWDLSFKSFVKLLLLVDIRVTCPFNCPITVYHFIYIVFIVFLDIKFSWVFPCIQPCRLCSSSYDLHHHHHHHHHHLSFYLHTGYLPLFQLSSSSFFFFVCSTQSWKRSRYLSFI
jgi:hypothetical protein